jgi:peptidoglycan/LPS O-acetylase OafA/YrhL
MGLVRLFLALVVAGDHFMVRFAIPQGVSQRGVDQWVFFNGGLAVFFFYVISGFLISYVLSRKYGEDLAGAAQFYRSRFIRIFCLYWPLLVIASVLFNYGPHDFLDRVVSIFIIGGDWIVPFKAYPNEYNPYFRVLGPVWSVGAELTFYAIAPWLLRSLKASIACFVMSLALRLWLQSVFGFHQAWTYHFFPTALCFFLAGHLARVLADCWPRMANLFGPPLLILAPLSVGMTSDTGGWLSPWIYVGAASFALSLPWLFAVTKDNRISNFFGDASYPLYLSHLFVLNLVFASLPMTAWVLYGKPAAIALLVVFCCFVVTVAVVLHHTVEKRCAALMNFFCDLVTARLRKLGSRQPSTA